MCVLYLKDDILIEEESLDALLDVARKHGYTIVDMDIEDTVDKYGQDGQILPLIYLERKQQHEQAVAFKDGRGMYVVKRYDLPM